MAPFRNNSSRTHKCQFRLPSEAMAWRPKGCWATGQELENRGPQEMRETRVVGDIASWGRLPPTLMRQNFVHEPATWQRQSTSAWLSALDVALLVLSGEFLQARVCVPERFAPRALASAVLSVKHWQSEGRIFAIHDLYPRYQSDGSGQPYALVERAISVFGQVDVANIGSWFSTPNVHLEGKRPQQLLASAPDAVLGAL